MRSCRQLFPELILSTSLILKISEKSTATLLAMYEKKYARSSSLFLMSSTFMRCLFLLSQS